MELARHRSPRDLLVIAAHPDDEIIGAGNLLVRLRRATIGYATDGGPPGTLPLYRHIRRQEARSALRLIPDGKFELLWLPFQDQTTHTHLLELTLVLASLIRKLKPRFVLSHPYEGGHPDHDSAAFAVQHALSYLRQAFNISEPIRLEFTSYFRGKDGRRRTGEFLNSSRKAIWGRTLSSNEAALKSKMLGCYSSQRRVLQEFITNREFFRLAPEYDFSASPHSGELFYERFTWAVSPLIWRAQARKASALLRLISRRPETTEIIAA